MFEMLVHQRSNSVTPLTPVSTPPSDAHHPSDLSPRSSNSSFGSSDGVGASMHSPSNDRSSQEFSALQRLELALARDGRFSILSTESGDQNRNIRLVKPPHSSSGSSHNSAPDDGMRDSPNGMSTCLPTTSPNDASANNIFQCPLCAVVYNSRHEFNEHLVTHSQQFACPKCSYFTDDEIKFKDHVIEAHDIADLDVLTDEEVRTPKTNSQGKMKTFKCKQCGYQAVTKKDFWEHTKGHIRQEKMLTCPKCPFVTEYKHHLEYHLRNHFGSKPFQCTKCSYSCVNKSMLNSHLKSHSNIYQYRCADCSYATKYCHSLKLHLRKYDHQPSMVLNPDGTPNPLPIIDVYGTRRGPKIKRTDNNLSPVDMGSTALSPVTPKDKTKPQKAPKRQNKPLDLLENSNTRTPPTSPKFTQKDVNGFNSSNSRQMSASPSQRSQNKEEKVLPSHNNNSDSENLLKQYPSPALQFNMASINPTALQAILLQSSSNGQLNPATFALQNLMMQNSVNIPGLYAAALNQYIVANNPVELAKMAEQRSLLMSQLQQKLVSNNNNMSPSQVPRQSLHNLVPPAQLVVSTDALDLRNPKRDKNGEETAQEDSKRRKRKGKAMRYERNVGEYAEREEDNEAALDFSNNNYTTANNNVVSSRTVKLEAKEMEAESAVCTFCDIAFPPVLYALHMKFHSSDVDPFKCNVCGTKSSDKVSFFVHLATASH